MIQLSVRQLNRLQSFSLLSLQSTFTCKPSVSLSPSCWQLLISTLGYGFLSSKPLGRSFSMEVGKKWMTCSLTWRRDCLTTHLRFSFLGGGKLPGITWPWINIFVLKLKTILSMFRRSWILPPYHSLFGSRWEKLWLQSSVIGCCTSETDILIFTNSSLSCSAPSMMRSQK